MNTTHYSCASVHTREQRPAVSHLHREVHYYSGCITPSTRLRPIVGLSSEFSEFVTA